MDSFTFCFQCNRVLRAAPSSPASFIENVFKLPTAEGTRLQRRDCNIYVNGLVFKPSISWRPVAPSVGRSATVKGRKRKAKCTTAGACIAKIKRCHQPNEETPHSMLNEDDFLQLEAFLSPCEDPIESIAGSIINSNDDDELERSHQDLTDDGGENDEIVNGEDANSSHINSSHGDVDEESSFEVAEEEDDDDDIE